MMLVLRWPSLLSRLVLPGATNAVCDSASRAERMAHAETPARSVSVLFQGLGFRHLVLGAEPEFKPIY